MKGEPVCGVQVRSPPPRVRISPPWTRTRRASSLGTTKPGPSAGDK